MRNVGILRLKEEENVKGKLGEDQEIDTVVACVITGAKEENGVMHSTEGAHI